MNHRTKQYSKPHNDFYKLFLLPVFLFMVFAAILVTGCATSSPIQRYGESKSAFGKNPILLRNDLPADCIYRVYERGATGFVPIETLRSELEQRAALFCEEQGKAMLLLGEQISQPPYIFGNFPRIEIVFACVDYPAGMQPLQELIHDQNALRQQMQQQNALQQQAQRMSAWRQIAQQQNVVQQQNQQRYREQIQQIQANYQMQRGVFNFPQLNSSASTPNGYFSPQFPPLCGNLTSTPIGAIGVNRFDPNSLANPFGAGSPFKSDGLMNPFSAYGSKFSNQSWRNPYATDAPKLYDSEGNYRGKLSANPYDPDSTSNPFGACGSPYSPASLNNPLGAGNPFLLQAEPIYVVPAK